MRGMRGHPRLGIRIKATTRVSNMSDSFHVGERVVCIDDSDVDDTGATDEARRTRSYGLTSYPRVRGSTWKRLTRPTHTRGSGPSASGAREITARTSQFFVSR